MASEQTPVVLFVFNRDRQLRRTLDCLKANDVKKLIVFADGPRNHDDLAGIEKVRTLINEIDWVDVDKHYQKKNKGLSQSIQDGLNAVFKKYGQAIILEDDVCVAPGFYAYMLRCLERYKDTAQVAGVTGLRYPFSRRHLGTDEYDVFFTPRFASWGWATWKRTWDEVSFDVDKLMPRLKNKRLNGGGADLPYAVNELAAGRLTGCWDVFFYMNMLLNKQSFVWPKFNMVVNTGLTEGSHANGAEQPHWKLRWENSSESHKTWNLPKEPTKNAMILADFLEFFIPENLQKVTVRMRLNKTIQQLRKRSRPTMRPKSLLNKAAHRVGYHVGRFNLDIQTQSAADQPKVLDNDSPDKSADQKPDPKDYSTTDDPQEVPGQKEAYYHALNNYVKPGSKVLDVGSGLGYGMAILSVIAGEVQGIDVDKKAITHAKKEYVGKNPKIQNVQSYNGYNMPFKDNEFDVVTCIDVLEHVEDYDRFLDELLRISKRYVLISTPNQRAEFTNPDGTPKNYWHLREWKPDELDDILKKHKKATVEWFYVDGPFDGPFKLKRKPSKDTLVLMPVLKKNR